MKFIRLAGVPLALEGHVSKSEYFFFDTDPRQKQELAILFGGFEKCAPDFEIRRKTYPYYVIEIPIKGRCRLEIGGHAYDLEKGSLGGFAPGVPHHYKCDARNPMEHIFFVFTGTEAPLLLPSGTLQEGGVVPLSRPAEILYLAEAILKKGMEKTELSHAICCAYLRALLLEQALSVSVSDPVHAISMERYRACRKYIDENFSSLASPAQAAQACSINIRYMSRLFKRYGKTTPHEYIMRLKLNKASSLLLTTGLSIKEVAAEVGFEDPYHFSRNFKQFHSLSPRHYRDAHLEKPATEFS